MSIKALLEAAEYVANVETTNEEPIKMSDQQQITTSPNGKVRTPSTDGTLQHWRKRAVAQSVKELSKTSADQTNEHDNGTISNGVNDESPATLNGEVKPFLGSAHDTTTNSKDISKTTKSPDKDHSTVDDELVSNHLKSTNHILSSGKLDVNPKPEQTDTTSNGELSTSLNSYQPKFTGSPIHPLPKSSTNSSPVSPAHQNSHEWRSQPSRKDLMTHYRNSMLGDEVLKRKSQLEAETREAHNKLEKTRRKHLKERFDELKSSVPNLGAKVSHLTILREALKYVQFLERKNRRLGEEHSALDTEKADKQRKIESLKQRLAKFMKSEDIETIINKVNQRGTHDETSISRQQITRHSNNKVYTHAPQSNRFLNQLIDKTVANSLPNTNQQRATIAPTAHWPGKNHVLQATPNANVLPQLSSTINQMWQHASDIRRVCTMLPAPQMMSSAEILRIPQNLPPATGIQRTDNSSMTHFRPISAASQTVSNAKSYTGWNMPPGGMSNFMRGCPNPLKIVVKPVGSAKQQARVMKSLPTSTADNKKTIQTTAGERARQNELVHRPHSSITPPPPSNITPYFPRFSVGSGGSPPLTTVLPRTADVIQKSNTGDHEKPSSSRSGFKPWRSLSDCDNEKCDNAGKFCLSASKRKSDSGLSDSSLSKISKVRPAKFHRHSFDSSSPTSTASPESIKQSTVNVNHTTQSNMKGAQGMMIPRTIPCLPVAPVMFPTFVNQAKSVTQVCYSTLSNTKPAVPASPAQLTKESGASNELSSSSNVSQVQQNSSSISSISLPNTAFPVVNNTSTNAMTKVMPVMGYSITPRVQPQAPVIYTTSSGVAPNNAVISTLTSPTITNTTNGSQTMSVAMEPAQMPQFQCFIPMGFPGVMQGSNGPQMAFQPTMGGFIPVMPQGQSWGFMMPQNMMFAPNNNTNFAFSAPESSQSMGSVSSGATVKPTITMSDCTSSSNPVTTSSVQAVSQDSTSVVQPQQSVQSRQLQPVQSQQFQMMPQGFPNQFMVPVAAAPQTGGFVFGGAPTMMQSPQGAMGYQMPMNIVGYPMQVQPPSFQFSAMPQPAINMMQRGFSFGFTGNVPTGVMTVGENLQKNEGFSGNSTTVNADKSTQNIGPGT